MAGTGGGSGDALDAESVAVDGDPEEQRLAEGVEVAKAVHLAEAEDAVVRSRVKLERAQGEVAAAEQIVADTEAAFAALQEG